LDRNTRPSLDLLISGEGLRHSSIVSISLKEIDGRILPSSGGGELGHQTPCIVYVDHNCRVRRRKGHGIVGIISSIT